MKKFRVLSAVVLVSLLGFVVMQCQHPDETVIPVKGPDPIVHGTQIINCTNCNTDTNVSGSWYHDKAHSNAMWETPYMQYGSLLTGRFDSFFINGLNFDEAHPEKITFDGYVWLNSVNTSEPGRDEGCLLGTFGTSATPVPDNNVASNKATLIAVDGSGRYSTSDAGFLVDANLTFLGKTNLITVKLLFYPINPSTPKMAGLYTEFEMTPKNFGLNDTNIGDVVKIRINSLMKLN